jgi:hypothetical protein
MMQKVSDQQETSVTLIMTGIGVPYLTRNLLLFYTQAELSATQCQVHLKF